MIHPFEIHRPDSIAAASEMLRELPDSALIGGGTELLQVMKMGLARFDHLVDVKGIGVLKEIRELDDGSLWIGAGATHREVERSPVVAEAFPALGMMERRVGNNRVRNMGTIGGNLCFAEPHSDPATFLLAAEASLELATADKRRELLVDDFLVGPLATVLDEDELLVGIRLPAPRPGQYFVYEKVAFVERPTASICCRLDFEHDEVVGASVVVGSIGDVPMRVPEAESRLVGLEIDRLSEEAGAVADAAASSCEAVDDLNGTAEYKRHLVRVMLRRAILQLVEKSADER